MSFILDALKKSEAERARQSGPTLVDPRIVPPRRGVPAWVVVLGLVLLANLAVLAVVLARGAHRAAPAASVPAIVPVPAGAEASAAAPATVGSAAAQPPPANVLPPPTLPAVASAPAAATPSGGGAVLPPVEYSGTRGTRPAPPPSGAGYAEEDIPPAGRLITPAGTASPAAAVPPPPRSAPRPREDASGLPTAEDLRVSGITLPTLSMALHAFDASPSNRYVLLNGQKLREGQSTAEGAEVEQITSTGAVMRWRDRRFLLTPGD